MSVMEDRPAETLPYRPAAERPYSPLLSPAALCRFALVTAVGLAADLWSKVASWNALYLAGPFRDVDGKLYVESETVRALPGWLHLKLTVNEGAVFGIGQGNRWLFVVVSVAAIGFLTWLFAASGRQRLYQILLGLLLAGVLGNMYDRVQFGYVRDMLYIFPGKELFGREVFPWIFNVADSLLCAGVALMIAYSLLWGAERPPRPQRAGLEAAGS